MTDRPPPVALPGQRDWSNYMADMAEYRNRLDALLADMAEYRNRLDALLAEVEAKYGYCPARGLIAGLPYSEKWRRPCL